MPYGEDLWIPWVDLCKLMEEAKLTGKVFYLDNQNLTFTPEELEEKWNKKQFRWGAVNWKLIFIPEGEW